MANWLVQQLRLTLFPDRLQAVDPGQWWLEVIGEEPDVLSARPKQNHVLMQSSYELGMLIFELLPDRFNWIYKIPPPTDLDDATLSLSYLDHALLAFMQITDKWFAIDTCPSVNRIAFGASLDIPVTDR